MGGDTAMTFDEATRLYNADRVSDLAVDDSGMRFLLLRSISRREQLERLAQHAGLDIAKVPGRERLRYLFESSVSRDDIVTVIELLYAEGRVERRADEALLINELYKLHAFDWGGLYQNSLEKTIVDRYVKRIRNFDILNDKVDGELLASMRAYALGSWYNHWTSIIIEDVFKDHPAVLPAVGLIKSVDFFVNGTPFDLKVTYLPEGFVKEHRKALGLKPELTLLRQLARNLGIPFDRGVPEGKLLEELWRKVNDHPGGPASSLIRDLEGLRADLVQRIQNDPAELIVWLYENQGVRRFDAANRLFLILINSRDYFASWKLKRSRDLLAAKVHEYLSAASPTPGRRIEFQWEGEMYTTTSDAIVVVHEA